MRETVPYRWQWLLDGFSGPGIWRIDPRFPVFQEPILLSVQNENSLVPCYLDQGKFAQNYKTHLAIWTEYPEFIQTVAHICHPHVSWSFCHQITHSLVLTVNSVVETAWIIPENLVLTNSSQVPSSRSFPNGHDCRWTNQRKKVNWRASLSNSQQVTISIPTYIYSGVLWLSHLHIVQILISWRFGSTQCTVTGQHPSFP